MAQPATVDVHLVFEYWLDCDAKGETRPSVHAWLTRNISNQRVDADLTGEPTLRDGGRTARYAARVDMRAQFELGTELDGPSEQARATVVQIGAEPYRRPDPASMLGAGCLNMDFFTRVKNEHAEDCAVQAGVTRIALAELFGPVALRRGATSVSTRISFPMVKSGQTARYADRGRITYVVDKCSMTLGGAPVGTMPSLQWAVPRQKASPCEAYIQGCERAFSPPTLQSTWANMDTVGIFRYVSRCGVLPAAAYVDAPLGHTGEAYFVNAARLALGRMQLSEDAALAWNLDANREECRHASYWLATLLSVYVQAADYIGDTVSVYDQRKRAWEMLEVEYFYHLRLRGGQGDCEDAASEFLVEADELRRLQTRHPLLVLAKRVLAAFYVVMLLDGISGREINLQSRDATLGAHMNSALVNKNQFAAWCQNYDERAALLARQAGRLPPAPAIQPGYAPTAQERQFAAQFPPIVMLEGTGPLDPNGVEHAEEDQEAEHAVSTAIEAASKLTSSQIRPMFHYDSSGKRQSKFYKTTKVMMMDEILKAGGGQCMWVLCVEASGGRLTASVEFQVIASASNAIQAMPEPELGPEQLKLLRHYMLDLHPMPDLEAPDASVPAPAHVLRAREQVADLERRVQALIARTASVAHGRKHQTGRMAKYHHFDREGRFADGLVRALEGMRQNSGHTVVGFRAVEERVTQDRGGYWFFIELD
jgi:hypothetical protein